MGCHIIPVDLLHGRKSEKTGETKGKFYKLKVNKEEFERKDTNTLRESQRKWEKVRENWRKSEKMGESQRKWEKVRENWEKVRENGRKSEKMGETQRNFGEIQRNLGESQKMGETKGKFYKLKVDKRVQEKKTILWGKVRENRRKSENFWRKSEKF